jgi:hypothetical protein
MNILEKLHTTLMLANNDGKLTDSELDEISMNLIQQFSWVVPTDEVIEKIARHKSIIEMGAGRGYWAKLISFFKPEPPKIRDVYSVIIDPMIESYDLYPQHNCFYPVMQGGPEKLREYRDNWALFICSPQYRSDMVLNCLKYFRGNNFLYVGDTNFSMNLPSIEQELKENWRQVDEIYLPNWPNSNNKFLEFQRRE